MKRETMQFIIKSIEKIFEDSLRAGSTKNIVDFWDHFNGEKISYIGFNFKEESISSVKLYYTVFTRFIPEINFPIKPLYQTFKNHQFNVSDYAVEKYSNGGGITFSIKINNNNVIEHGYYLRCKNLSISETALINSNNLPFNISLKSLNNLGVYQTLINDEVGAKIYAYVEPSSLYPKNMDLLINFNNIRGVEISRINDPNNSKYIYLGGEDVYTKLLTDLIPMDINIFKNKYNLNFVCPAFESSNKLCSIYLTSFKNNSKIPSLVNFKNSFN
ncbi:MAG: hypothetical protein KBE91_05235 [Bacteroidia bacterium]|nr:hypothetical protein [Bacteroidia bacterium]